jgi:hypothetical protein
MHLLEIAPQTALYSFVSGCTMIIGFFLIRFYFLVDNIGKDVKQILISMATTDEKIKQLEKDSEEAKSSVHEHGNTLTRHELQLSIMKNKSS